MPGVAARTLPRRAGSISAPVRVYPVEAGIWQISLAWSNAWLLWAGKDDALLIDTGLQRDRPGLLQALAQIGVSPDRVRGVLLTHGHCDHAGSAAYFAARGARIGVHPSETPYVCLPRRTYAPRGVRLLLQPAAALAFAVGEIQFPVERMQQGLVAVPHGESIEAPGGSLRLVATPGHTPGHAAFLRERDGVLFSGDAVMNIIPIRREVGLSLPVRLVSSDWAEAMRSARRLADLGPRLLLAGHGPPLQEDTAERLRTFARSLPAGSN